MMITEENLKDFLKYLKFTAQNNIYSKVINGATLKVDFGKKQINYPYDLTINEKQTCNFSQNENFVVFECVHRLLEKGYQPQHLELEPKWQLGRGAKGGRADILVKDQANNPLLLIECKTAGEAYEKEKKKMLGNGGQLFSYFQQEKSTRYLCLYASDFKKDKKELTYQNAIIKAIDRAQDIEEFKQGNENIKLYKNANNNKELFEVWKETFNCYFHYNGIFDYDVNAYEIELKPLKRKDLKPFPEASQIFNQFMEILRHNNISDNANAFNRFLSLMLCKIVDEEKASEEVLDFQIKEGEDENNPEAVQDRLQRLYAKGMDEHLGEKIIYVEDKEIKEIIELYPKETPIEKIEDIFKQIKYYTQNEFALKEVHNKELFIKNSKVLNEVIKMLQNFQFRYTKKQQLLGDFFELVLNHGVKQNEGQFFTPVPIVRFMILSLGLGAITEQKIASGAKNFLPKILDYACGAGHFLTESIDEIQHYLENISLSTNQHIEKSKQEVISNNLQQYKKSTQWAKDYIFGIEKDYRLARTSQIACFLNGDGDANIIYGDGLENHARLQKDNNLFDVILSNPPYAIKSFKNYLTVGAKEFTLFDHLTESSKEIENLFVERTAQLLKDGGRAAVILPFSILNNDSEVHFATRKILLAHFNIKAIAKFGSKTFGATGTNTVILFLEKRSKDFAKDRKQFAEDIFAQKTSQEKSYLEREKLFHQFINYRNLKIDDYKSFIYKTPNKPILQSTFYKEYQTWFNDLTEIKNLKKKATFKNKTAQEQKKELEKRFYDKVLEIEQQKFYFFMLTLKDDFRKKQTNGEAYKHQQTVIVDSGEKETAKAFLGYEFSNRKGDEGIKMNRNTQGHAINKMCEEANHNNPQKANSYILRAFEKEKINHIDEKIKEHVKIAKLTDMLDFEKIPLNNSVSLNPKINNEKESKWEMVRLGDYFNFLPKSKRLASEGKEKGKYPFFTSSIIQDKFIDIADYLDECLIIGDGGIPNIHISKNFSTGQHSYVLKLDTNNFLIKYVYEFINNNIKILEAGFKGIGIKNISQDYLKKLNIPLPPLKIQQKIVSECEAIDDKVVEATKEINACKNEIEKQVQAIFNKGYENEKLETICEDIFAGGDVPKNNFSEIPTDEFNIPIFSNGVKNKGLYGYTNKPRVKKPSITISARGTIGHVELRELPFLPIIRLIVVTPNSKLISLKYLKLLIENINIDNSGAVIPQLTVPMVKNLKIPLPPLNIQKEIIKKVEQLEQKINDAQKVVDTAPTQKEGVLKREL